MTYQHADQASGKWQQLTLAEQLGNIGSEVNRASRQQGKNPQLFSAAVDRALELFDLTIRDQRWRTRFKELTRAREVLCDAVSGGIEYHTSLQDLNRYFLDYALLARANR